MLSVGKWDYMITQEADDEFYWCLSYDYNEDFMVESKGFKTFEACKKDAIRQMKRMLEQFGTLIDKASEEKP